MAPWLEHLHCGAKPRRIGPGPGLAKLVTARASSTRGRSTNAMREALKQLLRAVRLERDAFVWMDFNDRATADGLIFVAVTRFLILVGEGWRILGLTTTVTGLEILLNAILNSLIFWLAYAGISFAVSKFLLGGQGQYAVYLRITGYAYPTLLLTIVTSRLGITPTAALVLGSLWFLAVVTAGIRYEGDLPTERAALAAIGGLLGWIIISSIFTRGLI